MPRIALNIVRYNHDLSMISECIRAALSQDFDDFTVTLTDNGSNESVRFALIELFGDNPKFRLIEHKENLGFSKAHNFFIRYCDSEFVMPLNPDAIMSPSYLRELLPVFDDPNVAAAEGKMLKPVPLPNGMWVLDGTGMMLSRARRAGERGQLENDECQYDTQTDVFGVSATAAAYRVESLEKIKFEDAEYFDEDFFTYWEDLDLSWRLRLAGYHCKYVPGAIVFHSRFAGQSKHGIRRPFDFVRHRRRLPIQISGWDWRNHLFAIIKNDSGWTFFRDFPYIAAREILLFLSLLVIQPKILRMIPTFFSRLPRILRKRKFIQNSRAVTNQEMRAWFI